MTIEERIRKLGIHRSFQPTAGEKRERSLIVAIILNAAGGAITPERAAQIVDSTTEFMGR